MGASVLMTPAERLQAVLDRVTYRKGWTFEVHEGTPYNDYRDGSMLMIRVTTPDSYHPDNVVQVGHRYSLPPFEEMPDKEIVSWLFHCIRQTEIHEAQEWFRLDGVVTFDPTRDSMTDPASRYVDQLIEAEVAEAHAEGDYNGPLRRDWDCWSRDDLEAAFRAGQQSELARLAQEVTRLRHLLDYDPDLSMGLRDAIDALSAFLAVSPQA